MLKRKPKVFIIGASGFLGFQLAKHLRDKFLVSGAFFQNQVYLPDAQLYPVTLTNLTILETLARIQEPDFIINAFGITNREQCESDIKMAENLNVIAPASFAILSNKIKAKFIQLSCAEIYDGQKGDYQESDITFSMRHEFGKQKIAAETYIRAQSLESSILRIGKVIGLGLPHRVNYFDRIRLRLNNKETVHASKQKKYSYLSIQSFVQAIECLLLGSSTAKHHLFHIGGTTMSEYEFIQSYCKLVGHDEKLIIPNSESDTDMRNISLSSNSFMQHYPNWKADTKSSLFTNLVMEQCPAIGIKKWQTTLQIR